jgi:tyrosine-protein kinase Etk/Wzc
MSADKGITDLLTSEGPLTAASVSEHIVPAPIAGVSLLLSGFAAPESPGRIFFSDRLPSLFAQLRQMFDILIIDTPPALTFSDARRIGRVCDGAILVVRSEKTSFESAEATAARLAADGIPVFGTILNDFSPDPQSLYSKVYESYSQYASAGPRANPA